MTRLRQNIQQKLARELSERGETPIAGDPGVEPVVAEAEPEGPATTTHLMEEVCEREPRARVAARSGQQRSSGRRWDDHR